MFESEKVSNLKSVTKPKISEKKRKRNPVEYKEKWTLKKRKPSISLMGLLRCAESRVAPALGGE
jgi:hypothetical protein